MRERKELIDILNILELTKENRDDLKYYIEHHGDIPEDVATKAWVLAKEYLTEHQKIKTINGQTLIGEGDVPVAGIGDYESLSNKPKINNVELNGNKTLSDLGITIPTKTSELTNDSGFLTQHQDISGKQDKIADLVNIRQGANKGNSALQPDDVAEVATSGDYNDLNNKPTIPSAVTFERILSSGTEIGKITIGTTTTIIYAPNGGGSTILVIDELTSTSTTDALSANQGRILNGLIALRYIKPDSGIPITDLTTAIQTSLGKADTALQSHQSLAEYAKTTEVTSAIALAITDMATHTWVNQQLANKQNTLISGTNIKTINGTSILGEGDITISGGHSYTAGANISIVDYVISVTGITVPTKLSELTNDSGYATQTWVNAQGFLTSHQSLAEYAKISEVTSAIALAVTDMATKTWVNTQGYLTEHQSLEGYATQEWVEAKGYLTEHQSLALYRTSAQQDIIDNTKQNVIDENNKLSYNYITDKPTIPDELSDLLDDSTHRTVTDTEKATWNAKYNKPSTGIPESDLASDVLPKLNNIFVATYGTTTYSEVSAAYNAGKFIYVKDTEHGSNIYVPLLSYGESKIIFEAFYPTGSCYSVTYYTLNSDNSWEYNYYDIVDTDTLESYSTTTEMNNAINEHHDDTKQNTINSSNKLSYNYLSDTPAIPTVPNIDSDIDSSSTNSDTAGAKAVYDLAYPDIISNSSSSTVTIALNSDITYKYLISSGVTSLTITLNSAPADGAEHYWRIKFLSGSTATTVTWPTNTYYLDGEVPEIKANRMYEITFDNEKCMSVQSYAQVTE